MYRYDIYMKFYFYNYKLFCEPMRVWMQSGYIYPYICDLISDFGPQSSISDIRLKRHFLSPPPPPNTLKQILIPQQVS